MGVIERRCCFSDVLDRVVAAVVIDPCPNTVSVDAIQRIISVVANEANTRKEP
jgi:uncharacterized Fe-S cluster-containing protein